MSTWQDEVLALAPVWRRSPSAHNTQPATLTASADGLELGWDPGRELVIGDPTRRDLWLSLGAHAECVVIAAAGAGIPLRVDWAIDAIRRRAALLVRDPAAPAPAFTAAEVTQRRSARGPYREPHTAGDEVAQVATAAGVTEAGLRLDVIPAGLVDALLPQADRWNYSAPEQVRELRRWLRLHPGHPAYHQDGLSDRALALPRSQAVALRAALSEPVWRVLARTGGPELMARFGQPDGRGTVVALIADSGQVVGAAQVAETGRLLLRIWLAAARVGLHVHPLSQLIDAPSPAAALTRWAAQAGGGDPRVLAVFRIGVPTQEPVRSARRGGDTARGTG